MRRFIIMIVILLSCFTLNLFAQNRVPNKPPDRNDDLNRPLTVQESLTRARIAAAEQEYHKIKQIAGELTLLAKDLHRTSQGQVELTSDNKKKLDKLEKLAKKVRSEEGGSDDDLVDKPADLDSALKQLELAAIDVDAEIKDLNRYGISARLVGKVNEIISLAKFIKKAKYK